MGKKDTVTKEYMSVPEHFADAFNFYLFDGKQLVQAEGLSQMDPVEIGIIFNGENKEITQKMRDVLKQCVIMEDDKYTYLILGVENQSNIHYAMPVKNMIYDALNYGQQVTEKTREHQKHKDLQGNEFLSGFAKSDKIKPVITLVIYFGTEEWDAPRCLKDMFEDIDEEILQFVSDYKLNLLIPKEIKDFSKFQTEFGKAMKYISVVDEEKNFKAVMETEEYKIIKVDTIRLLNECVGTRIPISQEGQGEDMEMCRATRAILEEGRLEGRLESVKIFVTTLRELGQSEEVIISHIMDKFHISENDAKEIMK